MPVTTTIPTTAELRYTIPNHGNYRVGTITQRLTFTGYTAFFTIGETVPAGARIIMASMKSATTVPLRLASTAAATNGQAAVALVWTAPTALSAQTTSNLALLTAQSAFAAALPSNDSAVLAWNVATAATNGFFLPTTLNLPATLQPTAALTLYVIPYAATTGATDATARYLANTSTASNGYTFGTSTSSTGSIDVQIVFEELVATPNT